MTPPHTTATTQHAHYLESLQPLLQSANLLEVCQQICMNGEMFFNNSDEFFKENAAYAIEYEVIKKALASDNSITAKLAILHEIFDKLDFISLYAYKTSDLFCFKNQLKALPTPLNADAFMELLIFIVEMDLLDWCIDAMQSLITMRKQLLPDDQFIQHCMKKVQKLIPADRCRFFLSVACLSQIIPLSETMHDAETILNFLQYVKDVNATLLRSRSILAFMLWSVATFAIVCITGLLYYIASYVLS